MRDYQEVPEGENGLFLIRQSQHLKDMLNSGTNLVLERLFKGKKAALVVFGQKQILEKYKGHLGLLELEDYTNVDKTQVVAWEIGVKEIKEGIFQDLPVLQDTEQFWWQVSTYHIRAILVAEDPIRRKELTQKLQNIAPERVFKLPKAFSNAQLLDLYKKRSFQQKSDIKLDVESILKLISL